MTAQTLAPLHQSAAAPALPGTWKLGAKRAITLQPTQPGMLRVAHGRIWATYDGPHEGPRNNLGDHVVEVGECLRVDAGQRIVIEAWGAGRTAYFTWDPAPAPAPAPGFAWGEVLQPLADLRMATGLAVQAAARVVIVLLRVAGEALLPRRPMAPGGVCKA